MAIQEAGAGEESPAMLFFACILGQVFFVGPFYLAQSIWSNKHKKTAKPSDFYMKKAWAPDPLENKAVTKACLSCGQMVDVRYSVCPFCRQPTAPKKPGDTVRSAYESSSGGLHGVASNPVIIQHIGQYIAGDKISIEDSVIQRSSVGGGGVTPNELERNDKTEVLEQYKSILHHVYGDGYVDSSEYELLKMLREREDITREDHERIEWEVLSERESMSGDDGDAIPAGGSEDDGGAIAAGVSEDDGGIVMGEMEDDGGATVEAREENGMSGGLEDW